MRYDGGGASWPPSELLAVDGTEGRSVAWREGLATVSQADLGDWSGLAWSKGW